VAYNKKAGYRANVDYEYMAMKMSYAMKRRILMKRMKRRI
jgi:hypothetical protein